MPKFRKKPVVIEAVRTKDVIHAANGDWSALPDWVKEAYESNDSVGIVFAQDGVHISTLEGTMLAEPDDWIIRGVKGEIYPCKPDIFEQTYEPVEE